MTDPTQSQIVDLLTEVRDLLRGQAKDRRVAKYVADLEAIVAKAGKSRPYADVVADAKRTVADIVEQNDRLTAQYDALANTIRESGEKANARIVKAMAGAVPKGRRPVGVEAPLDQSAWDERMRVLLDAHAARIEKAIEKTTTRSVSKGKR